VNAETGVAILAAAVVIGTWAGIRIAAADQHFRQVLCAPIDTTPEDEQ
jgi:hypothetical protein